VEVDGTGVLLVVAASRAERALTGAHEGLVDRQEQVAAGARRKLVDELHADRLVALGDDGRPHVARRGDLLARGVELDVSAQLGGRKVRVQLLGVLDQGDHVIVRTRIGGCIGYGDRELLAEVVRRVEQRQRVDELTNAGAGHGVTARVDIGQRAVREVRRGAEVVRLA